MQIAGYLLSTVVQIQIFSFCLAQRPIGDRCFTPRGLKGSCQLRSNCPKAQEDIRNGIRQYICGFQGRNPIVCCPGVVSRALNSRAPYETAKEWCIRYNRICNKIPFVNGVFAAPAIPAWRNEIPHMAAIGFGEETNIVWKCGGTLISENFILTAAHCASEREFGPARWVLLGTINLINTTATDGKDGQIHPITRRIRHPEYKPPAIYHDIALFEIGPAVTPNPRPLNREGLHPACLSSSRSFTGMKAIASGWGRVGYDGEGSPNLIKVQLDVLDLSFCQKAYQVEIRTKKLGRGIHDTMLCAGDLTGKNDTCEGDSGGPLQRNTFFGCENEVWGVTSFGKVCGFPNSPSIYINVYEYIPWIEDIVWPE